MLLYGTFLLVFLTQNILAEQKFLTEQATDCEKCALEMEVMGKEHQCPCLRPTGSEECLTYDSAFLASTFDEAMCFSNLVSSTGELLVPELCNNEPVMIMQSSGPMPVWDSVDNGCVTKECQLCKLFLINGFIENGLPSGNDSLYEERDRLQNATDSQEGSCTRLGPAQKSKNDDNRSSKDKLNDKKAKQAANIFASSETENNRTRRSIFSEEEDEKDESEKQKEKLLGTISQLQCIYKRGTELDERRNWMGLCNLCWQWRKLPDDYFPSYINEVNCDTDDSGCLSEFGSCHPVMRMLKVLKNAGTKEEPEWKQVSIGSAVACECQVEAGTALHSFTSY